MPQARSWNQDAPVARTASACDRSMSSMSSASSLAMKPIVAKARVIMPASGPKPNMATNRIAMITSWKVRLIAMTARQNR